MTISSYGFRACGMIGDDGIPGRSFTTSPGCCATRRTSRRSGWPAIFPAHADPVWRGWGIETAPLNVPGRINWAMPA
ncbi:hypothetical protein DSL92_05520 [Billgrantia gudaonensis]|uniref:Uncharacterized protein n=1 Tax=Billgrantia gudaonensis TaxID=376427 RepID=A0A432JJY2_9GAMM|nr:hypothetical protein DSL92_05520 [Halomonas gudaonensis]